MIKQLITKSKITKIMGRTTNQHKRKNCTFQNKRQDTDHRNLTTAMYCQMTCIASYCLSVPCDIKFKFFFFYIENVQKLWQIANDYTEKGKKNILMLVLI